MNVQFQISRNIRIYDKVSFRDAIDKYRRDFVDKNRSIGTLNMRSSETISLEHASHIVKSIEVCPDGRLIGEIQFLKTPSGDVLKKIIESGITPHYSLSYSIKGNEVQEIFQVSVNTR